MDKVQSREFALLETPRKTKLRLRNQKLSLLKIEANERETEVELLFTLSALIKHLK